VEEFPDAELEDAIAQLVGVMSCALASVLAMVAEYDGRETWRIDGALSMESWLTWKLSVSRHTAADFVRIARALVSLPRLAETLAAGRLSFDQLRQVTRYATPETDAALAESAPPLSVAALARAACAALSAAEREAELAEDEADAHAKRGLFFRPTRGGRRLRFWGSLPAAEGELFRKAIDRIVDTSDSAAPDGEPFVPLASRRADALVDLASIRVGADADPDRATVVVHLNIATQQPRTDADADAGVSACTDTGTELTIETLLRLACDSRVATVTHGPDGTILGVGRTQRTPPPWLRRQVRWRDGGHCVFPGCARIAALQVHHLHHWTNGGPTDLANLGLLCRAHHRLLHEGGWRAQWLPDHRWRFTSPTGRTVEATGPPPLRDAVRQRLPLPHLDDADADPDAA
jgi:hypothetical protein